MATNLILNSTNYTDPSVTNGKNYTTGGDYACNYPIDVLTSLTLSATTGSIYITLSVGSFIDLLGCDLQNNNVPVKKWLTGDAGQILEVDYIISATEAALKEPSSYTATDAPFNIIEYWKSISVLSTTLSNTDGFGSPSVLANSKIGPITMNVGPNQSIQLGSEPITVDLGSTGAACQLTIKYQ